MGRHVSAQFSPQPAVTPSVCVYDPDRRDAGALGYVASYDELARLLRDRRRDRVLVLHHAASVAARILQGAPAHRRVTTPTLLWDVTDGRERPLVDAVFAHAQVRPQVILPMSELLAVLQAANRRDLCIGGTVLRDSQTVILLRGDLEPLLVPFDAFQPSGNGIAPHFADFEVIDCGQTLRFGAFEAAFDAVLYERDAEHRRRLRAQMREEDRSLGASIRRLRLQRGVRQADFGDVPARTVARIENGEVKRPQKETLAAIAERLGVRTSELASF